LACCLCCVVWLSFLLFFVVFFCGFSLFWACWLGFFGVGLGFWLLVGFVLGGLRVGGVGFIFGGFFFLFCFLCVLFFFRCFCFLCGFLFFFFCFGFFVFLLFFFFFFSRLSSLCPTVTGLIFCYVPSTPGLAFAILWRGISLRGGSPSLVVVFLYTVGPWKRAFWHFPNGIMLSPPQFRYFSTPHWHVPSVLG